MELVKNAENNVCHDCKKEITIENEEIKLRILPNTRICRSAYKNMWPENTWVNYSDVRSMKPIDIYRNKITFPESDEMQSLSIPKLLNTSITCLFEARLKGFPTCIITSRSNSSTLNLT